MPANGPKLTFALLLNVMFAGAVSTSVSPTDTIVTRGGSGAGRFTVMVSVTAVPVIAAVPGKVAGRTVTRVLSDNPATVAVTVTIPGTFVTPVTKARVKISPGAGLTVSRVT